MEKDILDYLQSVGIALDVQVFRGMKAVTPKEARQFFEENFRREEVNALVNGVSVETYVKWEKWIAEGSPCQAITRRGRHCKKPIWAGGYGPADFEREGFCAYHVYRMGR